MPKPLKIMFCYLHCVALLISMYSSRDYTSSKVRSSRVRHINGLGYISLFLLCVGSWGKKSCSEFDLMHSWVRSYFFRWVGSSGLCFFRKRFNHAFRMRINFVLVLDIPAYEKHSKKCCHTGSANSNPPKSRETKKQVASLSNEIFFKMLLCSMLQKGLLRFLQMNL